MNERVYILLALLTFGWCILSVILFFKIWGMTSDVKEIKDILKGYLKDNGDAPKQEEARCDVTEGKPQDADEAAEGDGPLNWGLIPTFFACIILVVVILAVIFIYAK